MAVRLPKGWLPSNRVLRRRYNKAYGAYAPRRYGKRGRRYISAPEAKCFDTTMSATRSSTAGTWAGTVVACDKTFSSGASASYVFACLNPSARGTSDSQILGSKYLLKGISIRGSVQPPQHTALVQSEASAIGVMYLVMDKQPMGAQADGDDIFRAISSTSSSVYAYPQVKHKSRFRLLAKKTVVFGNGSMAGIGTGTTMSQQGSSRAFHLKWFPKKGYKVQITTGAAATPSVSAMMNCNIFLLWSCNDTSYINAASRCYYND